MCSGVQSGPFPYSVQRGNVLEGCRCFQCSQQPPLLSFAHCSGTGEGHTALAHDVIPLARSTGLHLGAEHPHGLRLSPVQGCSPEVVWLMPRLALTPQSRSGFAVLGQDAGAGCVPLASRLPSHRAPSQRSALRPPAAGRCAALTLKAECFLFSDRMEMSHCKHPPVTLPLPAVPLTTQPRFLGSPRPQHPLVLQKQKPFASLRQKQRQC